LACTRQLGRRSRPAPCGQNQPAAVADDTSSKRASIVRVQAGPDRTCKAFGATNHPFRKYAPLFHARPVVIVARQYPRRSVNGHPDSSCIVPCRLLRRRIERSFFEPKPAGRAKIFKELVVGPGLRASDCAADLRHQLSKMRKPIIKILVGYHPRRKWKRIRRVHLNETVSGTLQVQHGKRCFSPTDPASL